MIESDELDNTSLRAFFGLAGPCFMGLEFDDPLVTPGKATLSISSGGTVHPTVIAPCADPLDSLYLIGWGASGTTPGVQLATGVTLPLNPDSLTQAGLDAVNSQTFGAFLGVLDAQGKATATFHLPPALALATGSTHFAAVLLSGPTLFADASNAIELVLVP